MREEIGNDRFRFLFQFLDPLQLSGQQGLEFGSQIYQSAVIIFGSSDIQPKGARFEIHLSLFQRQDLGLYAPPIDKGKTHHHAVVFWKPTTHCLKLVPLKKPLARWRLFQFVNHRKP